MIRAGTIGTASALSAVFQLGATDHAWQGTGAQRVFTGIED